MANMHQRTTVVLCIFFFVFRRPSPVLIAQLCQTQNRPTENRFTVFVCTFARHISDVWTTTSTCHRNRVLSTNKIARKPMIFGKCKSSTKIGQRFQQLTPESTEKNSYFAFKIRIMGLCARLPAISYLRSVLLGENSIWAPHFPLLQCACILHITATPIPIEWNNNYIVQFYNINSLIATHI